MEKCLYQTVKCLYQAENSLNELENRQYRRRFGLNRRVSAENRFSRSDASFAFVARDLTKHPFFRILESEDKSKMAKKKRLSPNQLAELKRDFAGLKTIENYESRNEDYKTEEIKIIDDRIDDLNDRRAQKKAELDDLDNQIADTGVEYQQRMKGVRQQVVGQFGDDSPEYEAVGGTRVSNRWSGLHRRGDGGNTLNQ